MVTEKTVKNRRIRALRVENRVKVADHRGRQDQNQVTNFLQKTRK